MPMSYTGASLPAPGSNTAAGFGFWKGMLDYIFLTYNNFETATNASLAGIAAATPNANIDTIAKRAHDGSILFTGVGLSPSGTLAGLASVSAAGYTGNHIQIYDNLGLVLALLPSRDLEVTGRLILGSGAGNLVSTAAGLIDIGKMASVSGSFLSAALGGTGLISPTAEGILIAKGSAPMGLLVPGSVNNFAVSDGTHWTAAAFSAALLPDRSIPLTKISNLSYFGNPANNTITQNVGSFVNSAGVLKTVAAPQTVALTPPTTNSQWQVVYTLDNATLGVTTGVLGGTRDTAVMPAIGAVKGIWIFLPQNCTGIYSSNAEWVTAGSPAAKGWIDDRPIGAGSAAPSASGGGAGGGAPTNASYLISGVNGTLTAALDVTAASGGTLAIHGHNVRRDVNSASFDDTQQLVVSPDIIRRIVGNGNAVNFIAGSTDICIVRHRIISATLTSSAASGGSGQRFVFLDLTNSTPSLVLQVSSIAPNANCVFLGIVWYDSVNNVIQTAVFIDTKAILNVGTSNITPNVLTVVANPLNTQSTTLTNTTLTYQAFNVFPATTFYVPTDCHALLMGQYVYNAGVFPSGSQCSMAVQIANTLGGDGSVINYAPILRSVGAPAFEGESFFAYARISRGFNAIAIVGYANGATAAIALYPPTSVNVLFLG